MVVVAFAFAFTLDGGAQRGVLRGGAELGQEQGS